MLLARNPAQDSTFPQSKIPPTAPLAWLDESRSEEIRLRMNEGESRRWFELYSSALLELVPDLLHDRLDAAETAGQGRLQDWQHESAPNASSGTATFKLRILSRTSVWNTTLKSMRLIRSRTLLLHLVKRVSIALADLLAQGRG
jgi:hypothetical protein